MNRGVNVVIQTSAKEQRVFYAKPIQGVKLEPGKEHAFEWYDNKELEGETVDRIPMREPGVYRITVYEKDTMALGNTKKGNDPCFVGGPHIVTITENKPFDDCPCVRYSVFDIHHPFPQEKPRAIAYGFHNNTTSTTWTVSLGHATMFVERL